LDDQLKEEEHVAAFLEKPDYCHSGMKFTDWSREQGCLKFHKDATVPGSLCTIFSSASGSDMDMFFYIDQTIPNLALLH
jgi:hypothetical protein